MKNISENVIEKLNNDAQNIKETSVSLDILKTKQDIESTKRNIDSASNYINNSYKLLRDLRNELEVLENKNTEKNDYKRDLRSILEHESVKSIKIEDKIVKIKTNRIDIFDINDNKFKGNEYTIVFDYENFRVKFFGKEELSHKGYWTNKDPHPHVDGDSGNGCLGDAGSMLSISMNEYELYASYIIALGFLSQVNIDDPAGMKIRNWECIDENDNIIKNPYKNNYICEDCGEAINEGEQYECDICKKTICRECKTYVGEEVVCDDCLNEECSYCENCEDYYRVDDMVSVEGLEYNICRFCADDDYQRCEECGTWLTENYTFNHNDHIYCEECYNNITEE